MTAAPIRIRYRLTISIIGRVRFLSHLETVEVILSALRRAKVNIKLSAGMKPKPLIKLAMPRPVAVESWEDIVEIETPGPIDCEAAAMALSGQLPAGISVISIAPIEQGEKSAAARVIGATFRIHLDGITVPQLHELATEFSAADTVLVERRSPKQQRTIDAKMFVSDIVSIDGELPVMRAYIRLTEEGSIKPTELLQALSTLSQLSITARKTIRESIDIAAPGESGVTATPVLVGADVSDGPARPWGSC